MPSSSSLGLAEGSGKIQSHLPSTVIPHTPTHQQHPTIFCLALDGKLPELSMKPLLEIIGTTDAVHKLMNPKYANSLYPILRKRFKVFFFLSLLIYEVIGWAASGTRLLLHGHGLWSWQLTNSRTFQMPLPTSSSACCLLLIV